MIKHYQKIFKNPKDILDWISHDLRHMGLSKDEYDKEIEKAMKKYFSKNKTTIEN